MRSEHRWFYKQAVSFYLDAGRPIPDWVLTEIEGDSECRRFLREQRTLIHNIEGAIEEGRVEAREDFESRIVSAVEADWGSRQDEFGRGDRDAEVGGSIHSLAGAAALILIAVVLSPFIHQDRRSAPDGMTLVESQPRAWGLGPMSEFVDWTRSIRVRDPLSRELDATVVGAQRVLESLQTDYFPESVRRAFSGEPLTAGER